jgi:leukotriene-A4 hydrolase
LDDIQWYNKTYTDYNSLNTINPVFMGFNPEISRSAIPFEKGFQFINYLQNLIGNTQMQSFVHQYIIDNFGKSLTSYGFQRSYSKFIETYHNNRTNEILSDIIWSDWKYQAGFDPSNSLNYTTPSTVAAQNLALEYIALNGTGSPPNYQ